MKALAIILFITLASGCDVEVSNDGYVHNTNDYDLIDDNTKLRIKFDPSIDEIFEIDYFIMTWERIQKCSGLSMYPAPYVLIVKTMTDRKGAFYHSNHVIEIEVEQVSRTTSATLSHEMLHYLLYTNGLHEINNNHDHYLFKRCPQGIFQYEIDYYINGEYK